MAMKNPYNYAKPKNYVKVNHPSVIQDVDVESLAKEREEKNLKAAYSGNKSVDYLEQKIMTAKPQELTLMLYEGLVKFIKKAKLFVKERNIQETHNALIRAQMIVEELDGTLNMDYEVSQGLRALYRFMDEKLIEANLRKEEIYMDEALVLAEELMNTWREAMPEMI